MESFKQPEFSYTQARQAIEQIRAEISVLGANDSEFSDLNNIIDQLDQQNITPQEAIQQAQAVRDSKQDYH